MKKTVYQLTLALLVAGILPVPMAWAQTRQVSQAPGTLRPVALRSRAILGGPAAGMMEGGCGCGAPAPVVQGPSCGAEASCGCGAEASCGCDPCCLLNGFVGRIGSALDSVFRCGGCARPTRCRTPLLGRRCGGGGGLLGGFGCDSGCGGAPAGCGCGGGEMIPGGMPSDGQWEGEVGAPPTPPTAQEARGYQLWNMPARQPQARTSQVPTISPSPATLTEEPLSLKHAQVTRTSYSQTKGTTRSASDRLPANPLRN